MNLTLETKKNSNRREYLINNLIKKLKITGVIRTTNWFYKNALRNRFINVTDPVKFSLKIDSIISTMNNIYGNNWDFHLEPNYYIDKELDHHYFLNFQIFIVINYPEITITNSLEESHIIKDLIVILDMEMTSANEIIPNGISCTRGTLSYEEYFTGYIHSHVLSCHFNTTNIFEKKYFCLGTGEMLEVLTTMRLRGYVEEHFEMFLHTLNSMVEWESLEGVPYIRIDKITIGEEKEVEYLSKRTQEIHFDKIKNELKKSNIELIVSENRYKIRENENFKNSIKKIIIEEKYDGWYKFLEIKIGEKYFNPLNIKDIKFEYIFKNSPGIIIQNSLINFKVEKINSQKTNLESYKINPNFLKYATEEFEKQLYYQSVRNSTIEKYNSNNNAR